MASSGTINGNQSGTRPYLRISWSILSQDIPNNRSRLRLQLILVSPYNLQFSASKTGSNNGSSFTYTGGFSGTGTRVLNTREIWVNHNSDGTRTQSVSGSFNINVSWSDGDIGTLSVSGNMNLDSIPRASEITLFSMGTALQTSTSNSIGVRLTVADSSFRHDVVFRYGSTTIASWDNLSFTSGNTRLLTLTADHVNTLLSLMRNTTSGTVTVRVQTKSGSGGSNIGSVQTRNASTTVSSSVTPNATNLRVLISGSGRDDSIGKFVQNISRVFSDFSGTATGGATVSSRSIVIRHNSTKGNSQTINGNSGTTGIVTRSGTYEAIASVTDSRGRTTTQRIIFNVEAYFEPEITLFTATRSESTPTTVNIERHGRHAMGSLNPAQIVVERRAGSGSWSEVSGAGLSDFTGSNFGATRTSAGNDILQSYEFRLVITDSFNNTTEATATVTTQKVLFDIHENKGIGIGKLHEQGDLDVDGEAYFNGDMYFLSGVISMLNSTGYSEGMPIDQYPRGFSYFDSAHAEGFPNNTGTVLNFVRSDTRNIQLYSTHTGNRLLYRQYHFAGENSGWSDWRELTTHISGSNSNGEWIRFSDGTQICTAVRATSVATGANSTNNGFFQSDWFSFSYPAEFIDEPSFSVTPQRLVQDNSWALMVTRTRSNLHASTPQMSYLRGFQTTATAYGVRYIAIGRWR